MSLGNGPGPNYPYSSAAGLADTTKIWKLLVNPDTGNPTLYDIWKALTGGIASMQQFYFVAPNAGTYQNNTLKTVTLMNLFVDGLLIAPANYTFDNVTGTITFRFNDAPGVSCLVQFNP